MGKSKAVSILVVFSIVTYAVFNLIFLVLDWFVGEQWVIIALYNTFAHLFWIPGIFFLGAAIITRRWRIVLLLLPIVFVFLATYGKNFVPDQVHARTDQSISILTYNLYAQPKPIEPQIEVIRQADADIVLLQELTVDVAERFRLEFANIYPYMALNPNPQQGTAGQGIMSRVPITQDRYWQYNWLPVALGHQRATIEWNGQTIAVYNVHPSHPLMTGRFFDPTYRGQEIDTILDQIQGETYPVILAGDFNMPDLSDDYAKIVATFHDSYREAGWGMGFTFPNTRADHGLTKILPIPLILRLDYVFHSPEFETISARVWNDSAGSDHRPLLVMLGIR